MIHIDIVSNVILKVVKNLGQKKIYIACRNPLPQ